MSNFKTVTTMQNWKENLLDFIDYFNFEKGASKHTISSYRRDIEQFFKFAKDTEIERELFKKYLDSLEKKGFVIMKLGKPIKYIAVEPVEVVERVKKNIQKEAESNIFKLKCLLSLLNNSSLIIIDYSPF